MTPPARIAATAAINRPPPPAPPSLRDMLREITTTPGEELRRMVEEVSRG